MYWKYATNLQENTHFKCDFNKLAKQLCWNHTTASVPSSKFAANFQNTFSWEHLWRLQGFVKSCENVFTLVSMLNIFYESQGTNLINPFIPSVVVKLRPPRCTSKDLIRPIEVFVKRFGMLRSDARQNKTRQIFRQNEHFLPPDTQTHVCVSEGKKCLFFQKIGRALLSWNTHIDIRPFDLLPTKISIDLDW